MHADHFADELRLLASLDDTPAADRVLDAFRRVPREAFAGPGPWRVRSPLSGLTLPPRQTPDADPRWLYHSVLIVLDEDKGINIGDPSLWAGLLTDCDVPPGARILQVGAGVGYYTAVLSRLTGPDGHVVAYEVEAAMAARAAAALADWPNVEVRCGNAATDLAGDARFDLIVAFAGVTHIPTAWAAGLAPGGRLLLPLTGGRWWGAMILAEADGAGFRATTLGPCGFYPCDGARDDEIAAQLSETFKDPAVLRGAVLVADGSAQGFRVNHAG